VTEIKEDKIAFSDDNRFYLLGEFGDEMKWSIIVPLTKKIEDLKKVKDASLEIYISSHGGDGYLVTHIIELLEIAKRNDIKVKTIVTSHAFSAGSMLAVVGTKGERYISRMAEHLVHYGSIGTGERTPAQIERSTDYKKRWFKLMVAHYKKYSNIPDLEEHIKDDLFFIPADKCIKWGLADKYMEEL
jgi:ATP-dependent protease ClpP protease subunit